MLMNISPEMICPLLTLYLLVAISTAFALTRFSGAVPVLSAQGAGVPLTWVPAVRVARNVAYALAAYPAGALSDRVDRVHVLMVGLALLIAADPALAWLPRLSGVAVGVVLWGLHIGFTQGLLAILVADSGPA
jgi:MFS family permease